ncbi:MAG: hypothetical protein AB8C84_08730 [Oligoflexales bacterium]
MRFLTCVFLLILSNSGFSLEDYSNDRRVHVNVKDRVFEFHKSSFIGLEDTVLYKKIFSTNFADSVDLTYAAGVYLDTFEGIHFAIEQDLSYPGSGKRILPKWFAVHRNLVFDVLPIFSSYVSLADIYSFYASDLNFLGLKGKVAGPGWSKIRTESFEGRDYIYYILTINGADFEFVEVPGEVADESSFMMSHWVTHQHWRAVTGQSPATFSGAGANFPLKNVSYNCIMNEFFPPLNAAFTAAGFEGELSLPSDSNWQIVADDFAVNKPQYSDVGKSALSDASPALVRSKLRGKLGMWMFGSVWEWVGIPDDLGNANLRGGSCYSSVERVGPNALLSNDTDSRRRDFGFRLFRASTH